MRSSLPTHLVSNRAHEDKCEWSLSSNGLFTISSLWENLRVYFPKITWHNVVWLAGHIPRYSVITWLAILNRLATADRLVLIGINSSPCCSLCNCLESHDHLFFNCPYSMQIWEYISLKICVSWTPLSRSGWISTLSGLLGKSLCTTIIKLTFPTTVYHVRLERNCRKFQNVVESRTFTVVIL